MDHNAKTSSESDCYAQESHPISTIYESKVPASTTEHYSMLRTLEETKNPSSIRIYLEAKTEITLIFARVCIFTKERYRKLGKYRFSFAATSIKPAFFECDWSTAMELSRTLAWLRGIQILLDRSFMQRENSSHMISKARQIWAI